MSVFFIIFSLLLTSLTLFSSPADEWETYGAIRSPASTDGYTCRIDSECLNYLYSNLLNPKSGESVYQVCKEAIILCGKAFTSGCYGREEMSGQYA